MPGHRVHRGSRASTTPWWPRSPKSAPSSATTTSTAQPRPPAASPRSWGRTRRSRSAGSSPDAQEFPEHVDALEREHRVIEDVLAEAGDGTPTDPSWPTRLLSALELLRDHILKEQDGVFLRPVGARHRGLGLVEAVRARAGSAVGNDGPAPAGTRSHPRARLAAPHHSQHHSHHQKATDPRW